MVYSWYTKKRIIYCYEQGHHAPSIACLLLEEDIVASRVGIAKLIGRYKQSRTIIRCPGSGRPTVITPEIKTIIEEKIRSDDETTAEQLHVLLMSCGFRISRKTIFHCRADLGGHSEAVRIANSYVNQTKLNHCSGQEVTHKMLSKMLFGPTNVPSNSKLIKDSAAGNKDKHADQNPGKHHIH